MRVLTASPRPVSLLAAPLAAPVPARVQLRVVDEASEGQRLDNFLMRILKGVPKTHVYRIIRSGEVRVNKGRAQPDTRLALGDAVRLPPVRVSERSEEKAAQMAAVIASPSATLGPKVGGFALRRFDVLLEDDHLLAIHKPAGVAVHGGSGVSFGVIEQLRMTRPEAKFLELVHRLDRETSGILLVAKRRSALVKLQAQFKGRETGKTYLALVHGLWPVQQKVIDQALFKYLTGDGADGERRVRVVPKDDPQGMRAITLVKVAGTAQLLGQVFSLLEVTIKTGRTHQIRVHLASNGHVIAGDDKYGDFELNRLLNKGGLKRMFLHAWQLRFVHPASGVEVHLKADLPADLQPFAGSGSS